MKRKDLNRNYRPKEREDFVGNEEIFDSVFTALESGEMPIFLFAGPAGLGKTALMEKIVDYIKKTNKDVNFKYTDASITRKVANIEDEIIPFLRPRGGTLAVQKLLVMDEFELTRKAQETLKTPLQKTDAIVIICTNYPEKITDKIHDRVIVKYFQPVKPEEMMPRLKYICRQENIPYDEEALLEIASNSNGSVRGAISKIQEISDAYDKVTLDKVTFRSEIVEGAKKILIMAVLGDHAGARGEAASLLKETSTPARTFINVLHDVMLEQNNIPDIFKGRFAVEIARTEGLLMQGGTPGLQISGLLGQIRYISKPLAEAYKKQKGET